MSQFVDKKAPAASTMNALYQQLLSQPLNEETLIDEAIFGDIASCPDLIGKKNCLEAFNDPKLVESLVAMHLKSIEDLEARVYNDLYKDYKTILKNKYYINADKFKLQEKNDNLKGKIDDLQLSCRKLQESNKKYKEDLNALNEAENIKTNELSASYQNELDNILKSVEEQEVLINEKTIANEEIRKKLVMIEDHINTRKSHFEAYSKSKDIANQLMTAKKMQLETLMQQCIAKEEKFQSHLSSERLKEENLQNQIKEYDEMLLKYRENISDTATIVTEFNAKINVLETNLANQKKINKKLLKSHANIKEEITKLVEEQVQLTQQIEQQQEECNVAERECRQLKELKNKENI